MSEYFAYFYQLYSPRQNKNITPEKLANPSHMLARGSQEFCRDEVVRQGFKPMRAGSMVHINKNGLSVLIVPVQ